MTICRKNDILWDIEDVYRQSLKMSKNINSYEHDVKGEKYYRNFIKNNLRYCICVEIFDWHLQGKLDHEDIAYLFEYYEQT